MKFKQTQNLPLIPSLRKQGPFAIAITALLICIAPSAQAQTQEYSTTIYGPLGLNTIPTARMDPQGTIRAQLSTLDPYAHTGLGIQIAKPLYINLRQTAEISDLNDDADRLYPGIDFKLRLAKERAYVPQIAIGAQSALGHKRTAGEYLTLSKRYKSFDFTAGLGWGRFAGSATFDNPLGAIGSHFNQPRQRDGEDPNTLSDWFTGEKTGILAGVEYFPPIKGLSLKADYGGDRFEAEQAAFDFNTPTPWSFGLNYKPKPFIDIGIAAQGTDKIMGRLSLQSMIQNIRGQSEKTPPKTALRPFRTGLALPGWMELRAKDDHIALHNTTTNITTAKAQLTLSPHHSAPHQIGRAATHMANHAGPAIEEIKIAPISHGLHGPAISLMRRDLESAIARKAGSAEEIWAATHIAHDFQGPQKVQRTQDPNSPLFKSFTATLETQISLAEEDEGILHRSALILDTKYPGKIGYFTGGLGLRLNLTDNLDTLNDLRPQIPLPVRSDIDKFADRFLAIDTSYTALTHTIAPDLHAVAALGYLEEAYAGFGGEILYRPFDKRYAIGAESWLALKRDPGSSLNLGLTGDRLLTGHINGYYDIPELDMTMGLKAGRYLAEDLGATLSLQKNFKNGAKLEGFVTLSDQSDFDLFGGTTHSDHGLRFTLPLGGYHKHLAPAKLKFITAPFGRDIGQSIQSPLPLYNLTEPFSKAHILQHWNEITP